MTEKKESYAPLTFVPGTFAKHDVEDFFEKYLPNALDSLGRNVLFAVKDVVSAQTAIENDKLKRHIADKDGQTAISMASNLRLQNYLIHLPGRDIKNDILEFPGDFFLSHANFQFDHIKPYLIRNCIDAKGRNILWSAKTVAKAKHFVEIEKVNMFHCDNDGNTILAHVQVPEVIEYLLDKTKNIDSYWYKQFVRLYKYEPWFRTSSLIAENEPNHIRHKNKDGLDALSINMCPAIQYYRRLRDATDIEAARALIKRGHVNEIDENRRTAIFNPKMSLEVYKFLIEHGLNVNITDKYGQTALFHEDNLDKVEHYLSLDDIHVNHKDVYGLTALFYTKDIKKVKMLLEKGADVNIRSNSTHAIYLTPMEKKDDKRQRVAGSVREKLYGYYIEILNFLKTSENEPFRQQSFIFHKKLAKGRLLKSEIEIDKYEDAVFKWKDDVYDSEISKLVGELEEKMVIEKTDEIKLLENQIMVDQEASRKIKTHQEWLRNRPDIYTDNKHLRTYLEGDTSFEAVVENAMMVADACLRLNFELDELNESEIEMFAIATVFLTLKGASDHDGKEFVERFKSLPFMKTELERFEQLIFRQIGHKVPSLRSLSVSKRDFIHAELGYYEYYIHRDDNIDNI